jgi:tetratricopeptide (TPR) repeat protein
VDQDAARSFTDHYGQIAGNRRMFKSLQGLFDIVLLAKVLRFTSPVDPLLTSLTELPYSSVKVPESYAGVTVRHVRGDRELVLTGGCDIRARARFHNFVEAHSRSMAELEVAAQGASKQGRTWHDVPGTPLALPESAGAFAASAERAYNLGAQLLADAKYAEAEPQFTAAIAASDSFAQAYAHRAVARFRLERKRAALWDAGKAISLDPHDPGLRVTYRQLLVEAGVPNALKGCDKATRAGLADHFSTSGLAHTRRREYRKAIRAFDLALRCDPRHARACADRGAAKYCSRDYEGAIADCSRALKLRRRTLSAYVTRGGAHAKLGAHQDALKDFNEALKIDPGNTLALSSRAGTKRRLGDVEGCLADLKIVEETAPNCVPAHIVRGTLFYQRKDYPRAIKEFSAALAIDRRNATAYWCRGLVKMKMKDYPGARRDYDAALRIDPRNVDALLRRAALSLVTKDYKGALADCSAVLDIHPKSMPARVNRAVARIKLADMEPRNARKYLEQARKDAEVAVRLARDGSPERKRAEGLLGLIIQGLRKLE